jgi:hypothetical protein
MYEVHCKEDIDANEDFEKRSRINPRDDDPTSFWGESFARHLGCFCFINRLLFMTSEVKG